MIVCQVAFRGMRGEMWLQNENVGLYRAAVIL